MLQAHAPPGLLAAEMEAGADFKYVVHQASGMPQPSSRSASPTGLSG